MVPKNYERKCSTSLIRCNARNPPLGREEMGLGLYQEPGGETVTALFLPETTDSLFLRPSHGQPFRKSGKMNCPESSCLRRKETLLPRHL
jgi:hypothetical protein